MAASILIRATEAQRDTIREAAARAGERMAPWALRKLLEAADPPAPATLQDFRPGGRLAPSVSEPEPSPAPVKVLTVAEVRKRFPAPKETDAAPHGPHCQCLACRSHRA